MIDPYGDGLEITIKCKYTSQQDWMSFASWYSINKNLPDAKVFLFCEKEGVPKRQYFFWPKKCGIELVKQFKGLVINADVMAVRTYNAKKLGPIDCRKNDVVTFVSYLNGCGSFVLSEGIDNGKHLFPKSVKKFLTDDMSVNELKILKIWEQLADLYLAL
jgi:hypothetical protein